MYSVAVCDDERVFLEQTCSILREILTEHNEDFEIDCFESTDDLEKSAKKYNLYVLDIMIGDTNGIDYAELLRERGVESDIIFITSSPAYALAGYSVHPADYILKPVSTDKLREPVLRCLRDRHYSPSIVVNSKEYGKIRVNTSEITYCEVMRNDILIHCIDGRTMTLYGTFSSFCSDELPGDIFYRCHRSYAVNMQYAERINRYDFSLSDGTVVPISKNSYNDAKKRFESNSNPADTSLAN